MNENHNLGNGRIQWKRRAFTHVPPGTKPRLFSQVKNEDRHLFENLNNRLEIDAQGQIRVKEGYDDGYFPVWEELEPKEQAVLQQKQLPLESGKCGVENVVTEVSGMGSANFSLKLCAVKKIIEESNGREVSQIFYVFTVQTRHGENEKMVSGTELEKFTWVQEATAGLAYFQDQKDRQKFSAYVHQVLERDLPQAKQEITYELNGWKHFKDGWRYLYDKGIVGEENDVIKAAPDLKLETLNISRSIAVEQFLGMEEICKTKDLSRMLMLFAGASVMETLFETVGFPIKSVVALLGTTNSLKTSVALVFTKIFNAKETTSPEVTFSSTRAGIETFVAKYRDAILLVDDFMPGDDRSKQAELNAKLELLCRLYGDRAAKKRMLAFSNVKHVEYPVRGCCIITGEHMTGVASSQTRILSLNLEKGGVDKDKLKFYQNNPLILPTFLYGFIEFLTHNQGPLLKEMKAGMEECRRNLNFKTARLNETASHFLVTLDVMLKYFQTELAGDAKTFREEWTQSILRIFQENDKQLTALDVAGIILEALKEGLLSRQDAVKPVTEISKQSSSFAYYDEDFIYIRQKDLYVAVKAYCAKYDCQVHLQQRMLIAKLKEKDVLECAENSEGHLEASRKLQQGKGVSERFLYVKRRKMNEILENIN